MNGLSYSRQSQHVIIVSGLYTTAYYVLLVILPYWNIYINLNHVFYAASFCAYFIGQFLGKFGLW